MTTMPWNVGRPFLLGGTITNLPAFGLTFMAQVLLRALVDATRQKGEKIMMTLKTWTKTKLRNVPHVVADLGLNFTIAVIATIDGPDAQRRGRLRFRAARRRQAASSGPGSRTSASMACTARMKASGDRDAARRASAQPGWPALQRWKAMVSTPIRGRYCDTTLAGR